MSQFEKEDTLKNTVIRPSVAEKKHKELYDAIPKFQCISGCNDCCGPVAYSEWEWGSVPEKKNHNVLCITCPYSTEGGCSIYDKRPLICRLFGAVDTPRLRCPHGAGPKKKMTEAQAEKLMRKYSKLKPTIRNFDIGGA